MNEIGMGVVNRYEINDRSYLNIFESHHKDLYVVVEEDDRRNFVYGTLSSAEIYEKYGIQTKRFRSDDPKTEVEYGRMSSNQ